MPAAISGFEAESLLAALYSVLRQKIEGRVFLDNCYGGVVLPGGNPTARRLLGETLVVGDAVWRGIGTISSMMMAGTAIGPVLAGEVYDVTGSYFGLLATAIPVALVAASAPSCIRVERF